MGARSPPTDVPAGTNRNAADSLSWRFDRATDEVPLGQCAGSEEAAPVTPRFSVLTAVCDPPAEVLSRCLASVSAQDFGDFEHVIVDDGSMLAHVRAMLCAAQAADSRVRVLRHEQRQGIISSSADALAAATGDLVALLDHDDELAPHALARMHVAMLDPLADCAYSDHDVIREDGRLADPSFKPDFSPERLRHQNYITHLLVARRDAMLAVGGFRPGFEGAQDHDMVLRLSERNPRVLHIPEVLYHWRQIRGSVAIDPAAKSYAYAHGRQAVQDHCARLGLDADVELGDHLGTYRVRRNTRHLPMSVLIDARLGSTVAWGRCRLALDRLVPSLLASDYSNLEIIVALDSRYLEGGDVAMAERVRERLTRSGVIVADAASGESAMQRAAALATGEIALLLDEDMVLMEPTGLAELASQLSPPLVTCVGGLQVFADGTICHAGFVTHHGLNETLLGWPGSHPGPGRLLAVAREVSALDPFGSMMDISRCRALVQTSRERLLGSAVTACLRDREAGGRVLWTPNARWYRLGATTATRRQAAAVASELPAIWSAGEDPYYNVNLEPQRGDWLERPGRAGAAPYYLDEAGTQRWV